MSRKKEAPELAGYRGGKDQNSQNNNTISEAIAAAGLGNPDIIHDGKIHRFTAPDDRPGSRNCWVVSFGAGGAFGSWRLGFSQTWSDKNLSYDDNLKLRQQIRIAAGHRRADLEILRKDAANDARRLWDSASSVIAHPYPDNKRIKPYGVRQSNNVLLIPMLYQGQLVNIQRIYPDGAKRFLKGGRVCGCYMPLGALTDHIYVSEGYATGCSYREHTGASIAVAFNAGNLLPVAKEIRKKYPEIQITVAADNDIYTPGNPGLVKARHAAACVGGDVVYPVFDHGGEGTDFNDYVNTGGVL